MKPNNRSRYARRGVDHSTSNSGRSSRKCALRAGQHFGFVRFDVALDKPHRPKLGCSATYSSIVVTGTSNTSVSASSLQYSSTVAAPHCDAAGAFCSLPLRDDNPIRRRSSSDRAETLLEVGEMHRPTPAAARTPRFACRRETGGASSSCTRRDGRRCRAPTRRDMSDRAESQLGRSLASDSAASGGTYGR